MQLTRQFATRKFIIDAWQSFNDAGETTNLWPRWVLDAIVSNSIFTGPAGETRLVPSPGAKAVEVPDGAWIIKNADSTFSVLLDEIFKVHYEPVVIPDTKPAVKALTSTPIPQEQIDFCKAVAQLAIQHGCHEFTLSYQVISYAQPEGHAQWSDEIKAHWTGNRHNENRSMNISSQRRVYVNIDGNGIAQYGEF